MSSTKSASTSNSSASSSEEASTRQDLVKCYVCRQQFDDMAEMQRHTLTEHIQKGDLPNEDH
jgi:hypothetical protein